ncbi:MAG: DNA mismatch repair protein MutS [Candidatus Woesearchaeota archaeon]|jgi:DNA mismatch repair protein MutS
MKLTPAMQQYMDAKEKYPDAIMLFRMGDFYECFFEDAITVSKLLGITLTSRGKDETKAPLAGLPYHALDKYLKQLVESGKKIAICEQIEDPKKAVGIVKRAVTRVISPGTVVEDSILQDKANNYLLAIFGDGDQYGIACCDVSTGEFTVSEIKHSQLLSEIARYAPSEILVSSSFIQPSLEQYAQSAGIFYNKVNEYFFWFTKASDTVKKHFNAQTLGDLQVQDLELSVCAAGALIKYLQETQKVDLSYIRTIQKQKHASEVHLDTITIRNLELLRNWSEHKKQNSLLSVLDKTQTSMGGRLLRNLIVRPLAQVDKITTRLACVENLKDNSLILEELQGCLHQIADIERIISRISYGHANARDLITLKQSFVMMKQIQVLLHTDTIIPQVQKQAKFENMDVLISLIDKTLREECPLSVREGGFIKKGFNTEIDELWDIKNNSRQHLAQIEKAEAQRTKIPTLKVKYNRIFGYFIEVSKRYVDLVPENYTRKQSTANAERYVIDELKELEVKILSSQDKIQDLEYQLFLELVVQVLEHVKQLQQNAKQVAYIDCLQSFAQIAMDRNYCCPTIHQEGALHIEQGRHPVVELNESSFVANDCVLNDQERMMIITGPNMAGKSTYMRQVALITLMAHIGSFVPAQSAQIPVVDRIFTRVGAYDDLAKGQSTFMVEMSEVATILNNATAHSLVILDEIGAGTSTYDGVSIAWAVAHDLATRIKAKALFATHYHVLTKLDELEGVVNYNIAVLEKEDTITFLRKIVRGGTDRSYGIHVAKLAGVPTHVVEYAKKVQVKLEDDDKLHKKIVVEKKILAKTTTEEIAQYTKLKQQTLLGDEE